MTAQAVDLVSRKALAAGECVTNTGNTTAASALRLTIASKSTASAVTGHVSFIDSKVPKGRQQFSRRSLSSLLGLWDHQQTYPSARADGSEPPSLPGLNRTDWIRQDFGNNWTGQIVQRSRPTPTEISLLLHFSTYVCYAEAALRRDLHLKKCKFGAIRVNYHSAKAGKGVSMSLVHKSQIKSSRCLVFVPQL